ncbi:MULTISPECIES: XRE family transcriptional regulator [unclassified Nocardioides]|uniref:XRE family transcriptional regulator n=1 Tax=unclassified Nocardioides TaxID=2615069 RepID=UPI003014FB12
MKALVEPQLLIWARRTANLEPKAADRKIGVPDGRVEQWETGERAPTIAELRRACEVYNRPLGVFFLPEPPQGFETLRDFRRLALGSSGEWSADLHAEYRRAHDQRDALLEIAELDHQPASRAWRLTIADNIADNTAIAREARDLLEGGAPLTYPRPSADEYTHLGYWTAALEETGVLVMHTAGGRVSPDEMRAFSLYFDEIPVIVLNGADYPRGRLFSLLHEYAHLLLHTAGLCDTRTDQRAVSENRQVEARCNAIAADILMPAATVLASDLVANHSPGEPWTLADLVDAAKPYGVSAESFLRRLVTLGRVPATQYQRFRDTYRRDEIHRAKPGGGNFYINKARDLGKGYVRTVTGAHRRALIDSTTAATYLDVKVNQIPDLAAKARI